jgi:Flp pilus assembly protein TadD
MPASPIPITSLLRDPLMTPAGDLDRARGALRAGQHREAEAVVRQVLQQQPSSAEAWLLLGTALREAGPGRRVEAIKALQRAVTLAP